ncbi:Uncharacterised protein [Citrobacter freundii]|nr:Uncharacterised protein [Citrobacter freundii]
MKQSGQDKGTLLLAAGCWLIDQWHICGAV